MIQPELAKALSDDTVFNCVNKEFISLRDEDIKTTNVHFKKALDILIDRMKSEDSLFSKTFVVINFTGSYYKGTRVGAPDEFDLNVVIKLPMKYNNVQFKDCQPGYTMIYVGSDPYTGNHTRQELKTLNGLTDGGYLNQASFRRWIEGIFTKVMQKLPSVDGPNVKLLLWDDNKYCVIATCKKSGPAFTITLNIPTVGVISIDLVFSLAFTQLLNNSHIRPHTEFKNPTWFAIPKPLGATGFTGSETLYWRFSFFYQEKEILSRHGRVKPVIRQMKKLRDSQQWKSIASYYIETLFLNKLETMTKLDIPFTLLLYTMLWQLYEACRDHRLTSYWDRSHNLFDKIQPIEMYNITMRIKSILKNIASRIATDPCIIAKYMLNPTEYERLQMTLHSYKETSEDGEVVIDKEESQGWCSLM